VPLQFVLRAPFEGFFGNQIDTMAALAAMFGPGGGWPKPAAFIVETIQAEGGINVASREWLRRLSELAVELGALLIVDDIQVGCGRSGPFFSFERADIKPDIVCLSKSIGGMGMPMALTLIRPSIDVWGPGDHVGTFRGNNLAFIAAAAALDYWQDLEFTDRINQRGQQMLASRARIAARHPSTETRGLGMIQGLVLPSLTVARATIANAFRRGLIVESSGAQKNVIKLLPPLTIGPGELQEGLDILAEAVEAAIADG